ncbi:hypothetical protein [Agrococcus jejuensis]|uniref:hypothetical protein n=1 Tax=Agrococcus jejuensis TaxID=399736 RepID=UPI0011A728EA|nr:hypothetical protein [Agrococcus jejuensis]
MTAITGEVATYLEILGLAPDAPRVSAFVDAFGVDVEVDEMELGGEQERYVILADAGVELNFTDGELTAIFAYLDGDDEHEPFRTPGSLIDGLTLEEDRDGIRAVLGAPMRQAGGYDFYAVGDRFLHVEYADDHARMITALLRDPLA